MGIPNGWSLTGISDGIMQGNVFPLHSEIIYIGTDINTCAIIYPTMATGISSIHCQLTFNNNEWILTDFSDNGTWLNGVRLVKGTPNVIRPNDEIMLANSSNKFVIKFIGTNLPPISSNETFKEKYFSFKGRLNRKPYILRHLLLTFIYFICFIIAIFIFNPRYDEDFRAVSIIAGLPTFIPALSLVIRRFHDTEHSGWWYFTFFIPFVSLYTIYLVFFKKGTDGTNRYGNDPLANR